MAIYQYNPEILTYLRERHDYWLSRGYALRPTGGAISVGSEGVRAEALSDAIHWLIVGVYCGQSPDGALSKAGEVWRLWVKNWNAKREWQVHIALDVPSLLEDAWRKMIGAVIGVRLSFAEVWKRGIWNLNFAERWKIGLTKV